MIVASGVLLLLLALIQAPPSPAADALGVVRTHYAAAAYEEALAHIAGLEASLVTPELEQYRALCLMALGRVEEGTLAFERLVRQAPLYVIPDTDISPRMLSVFLDVRRRVLPLVAREQYNRAKASFDEKRYRDALVELRALLGLLSDPAATADAATTTDLRQLADGFVRLAEAEIALAERAAAAAAAPPPEAAPPSPEAGPAATPWPGGVIVERIVIYSRDDEDVVPPIEVSRFMPPWNPPPAMRRVGYRGELEVVVDEAGRVESARMLRASNPAYDVTLLGATERWRFQPARRDGEAVKYRLTFEIVLAPLQ